MATERPEDCPPAATDTPGVWPVDRPGRPQPYGVQWREIEWDSQAKAEVERKRTEFYAKAADRDRRRLAIYRDKLAGRGAQLSRAEQEDFRAFAAAAGGVPWQTVFANHLKWLDHTGLKPNAHTVNSWCAEYLKRCTARVKRREMAQESLDHKETLLEKFAASFGHLPLNSPKAAQVETWIDDLGDHANATFNSHRKILAACFNEAVAAELLDRSPLEGLHSRRAVIDNRKKILKPWQMATLFHIARHELPFRLALGRLALEAFVGIRHSSAFRLRREDVRTEERTIYLPALDLKTGQESGTGHLIQTAPEQVWTWLAISPEETWSLAAERYQDIKSLLFVRAGIRNPGNTCRKSFCTYDLALHGNPSRTSNILGHVDLRELKSYNGIATKAEGALYQSITPQTCLEIARAGRPPEMGPLQTGPTPADV